MYENEITQLLKESAIKLENTILDLNNVLKIQLGTNLKLTDVNVYKLVNKIIDNKQDVVRKSSVKLYNNIPDDLTLKTVKSYLKATLITLISNSIKYSSPERDSWVKISSNKTKGYIEISVEDNGIGIDLERHGRIIFGMYKRFHNKDSKGIGLYISKNQVEALGGEITVDSEVGKGSIFRVLLPYEKFKEISLIEDDNVQIFLLKKFIEKTNLVESITSFKNGKEAFNEMKERSEKLSAYPDLIFLDLNMPVWSGWDFYDAFKTLPNYKNARIMILTSSLSEEDYQTALKHGLDDSYIVKPINYEKLEKTLKSL